MNSVERSGAHVKREYVKTSNKISDYFKVEEEEVVIPAPPATYCYKWQSGISCYRAPIPGKEHRLVGTQGTGLEYNSGGYYAQSAPVVGAGGSGIAVNDLGGTGEFSSDSHAGIGGPSVTSSSADMNASGSSSAVNSSATQNPTPLMPSF